MLKDIDINILLSRTFCSLCDAVLLQTPAQYIIFSIFLKQNTMSLCHIYRRILIYVFC